MATVKDVMQITAMIKKSFPTLPKGFYDMFDDRIIANKFTVQRLKDAVTHVIDNCRYPQPSIADFISYDKTLKFKTWDDMTKEDLWNTYLPVKFPDRPKVIWVHANDIAAYKLEKYMVS